MPPREAMGYGPGRATLEDINGLNRLFSEAFTDRYHRDGLTGVRVPHLSPAVWRYAIEDAGTGALVWRDADGELAAFNMIHQSGREGWMGPLAVRPPLQGRGLGRHIVRAGIEHLRAHGVGSVGLETMPRTTDNIGFYSALGFRPGYLTITLHGHPAPSGSPSDSSPPSDLETRASACRALLARLAPGVDYSREIVLTERLALGGTSVVLRRGQPSAFAVWHSAPLAAGRATEEVRVLKLAAEDPEAMLAVLGRVAAATGRRVSVRCETAYGDAYAALLEAGFRVQWTDLRMYHGSGDVSARATHGIVMSNWEI